MMPQARLVNRVLPKDRVPVGKWTANDKERDPQLAQSQPEHLGSIRFEAMVLATTLNCLLRQQARPGKICVLVGTEKVFNHNLAIDPSVPHANEIHYRN
jgi:hypothetical protein